MYWRNNKHEFRVAMREGDYSHLTPHLLGDVVISMDTAEREAQNADMSMERRFNELLVHGILHLFSYDHENSAEEARRIQTGRSQLQTPPREIREADRHDGCRNHHCQR